MRYYPQATDKSIHTHDKALHSEHKMEQKMHQAQEKFENSIKVEKKTSKDIEVCSSVLSYTNLC